MSMRADLELIARWIEPNSSVLDLGCGDGTLLRHLRDEAGVRTVGLEIDEANIEACVKQGLDVIQANLNDGLGKFFSDNSFDYVVMTQTLQATDRPDLLIDDMLRVGEQGVVTFPNMAHWKARLQLGLMGIMPKTRYLPNEWYDTPNIHLCTVKDFHKLCRQHGIKVLETHYVDHARRRSSLLMRLIPNLFGEIAIFRICNTD